MDHDKIYKPAFRLSGEVPANWLDGFMEQVNKDIELQHLSDIMKAVSRPPESCTITIRPQDLWAAPDK